MRRPAAASVVTLAITLWGCASVHTYDAAREINPAHTLSASGSLGIGYDKRLRGSGSNGWRHEQVLMPDATVLFAARFNQVVTVAVDPLPPAVGVVAIARYRPENDWAPTIAFSPSVSRLVFPWQNVWGFDAPLSFSYRAGLHWVFYGGPKYLYQSRTLEPASGLAGLFFPDIPNRPAQPLQMEGAFLGLAFGYLHAQISPEVDVYQSLRGDGEQIVQAGVQFRLSL